MFFRYDGEIRKSMDLDNVFSGACFLLGGSPCLMDSKDKIANQPIIKMAMNNAATIVRPDLWVGADISKNYSTSVLVDPGVMKFTYISRRDNQVNGRKWKEMPNTYFMSSKQTKPNEFFLRGRDFSWDKNVFVLAIQLAYRLGFRKVYLLGCSFKIAQDKQYCYETRLDKAQVEYNQKTYNVAIRQVRSLLGPAKDAGFEIISCTTDSKINEIVPFIDLDQALRDELSTIPAHDTVNCDHPKERDEDSVRQTTL